MKKYDITCIGYDELYGEEQKEKHIETLLYIKPIKDKLIVDVGCGTGLMEEHLLEAKIVIGIDISMGMLKNAKRRFQGNPKFFWIHADAENIPIKSKSSDTVLMITVVQNLPDPIKALKELEDIVKVDGEIIVTFPKSHYTINDVLKIITKFENLKLVEINNARTKDTIAKFKRNIKEKAI
ncbi:MAG: class I SAM-dependent methyltransferase [Candidatus Methanomethylicia archaeon]|nr:class I SAM-dependent methyltransferase [Candidatus Methanomethylicia archaeon]